MTIAPQSKKNKPGQPKEERVQNDRKRSRPQFHSSNNPSQKVSKVKIKQRREAPRPGHSDHPGSSTRTISIPHGAHRVPDIVPKPVRTNSLTIATPSPPISPPPPRVPTPQTVAKSAEKRETEDGYNSGDEYEKPVTYSEEREAEFKRVLKEKRGFEINEVMPDGACLFRSVSDQIYGDEGMHDVVRKRCCDYMELNADYFQHFVTENFKSYITRKRQPHTHGNHVEIQAMSEQYCRLFEIYEYSHLPRKTFDCDSTPREAPIRLSYHNGNHYNSVRDPYRATIGIGLGLAELNPGLADQNLMNKAIDESLNETERKMLIDKARLTDYQATDQALLAQVARDSLQDFYGSKKSKQKNLNSLNRIRNSPSTSPRPGTSRPTPPGTPPHSPPNPSKLSQKNNDTEDKTPLTPTAPRTVDVEPGPSRIQNMTPVPIGSNQWALSDWISENDEDSVLAAVLQQSAQEFFKKDS